MNADVEKAVEALKWLAGNTDSRAMDHIVEIRQALRDQEAEIARLRDELEREQGVREEAQKRSRKAEALLRECLTVMELHPATHARITAHLGAEQ